MARYDVNVRDYWRIIRKRRNIVVLATILFTVFSYIFALIRTPDPLYEATSAVKVEQATDLTTLLLGTVSWTSWDNVSTQAVIINSFPVMERTAKQMGLIPDNVSSAEVRTTDKYLRVVTALKSQVETEQEGNTNIINITATSTEARQAALLANSVAEAFHQSNVEERNKKVRETRQFIERQLGVVESLLQRAEEKLRNFEENTNLVSIDAQTTAALDRLTNLENEIDQLQQRRVEIKRQHGMLQRHGDGIQLIQEAVLVESPPLTLVKLTGRFRDLSLRREVLLNDYKEEHPEVKVVDAELHDVISEIDKELVSMLAAMDSRLNELEKRLQVVRSHTMTIPESALTLARLRREVDVNADLFAQLKAKYQEVMIQESGLLEEVKIIKPALEPTHPVNAANTMMNTLTGGVIGLVLGLVLALIVETMDTSLGTIEDVEEILAIPVLGVIPSTEEFTSTDKGEVGAKLKDEPLVTHFAPLSPISEAYRSLRTNLQFIRADKKAKTFLITSSSLQEGKTYNVVNLSLSLAQAGEKVLLIDADLRRPAVHRVFGLERQPGLTDYIMGISGSELREESRVNLETAKLLELGQNNSRWQEVTNTVIDLMLGNFEIEDILKTPGLDNLHIINAGQSFLNPAEILRSPRFKEFLREVRDHYDIIVVDTPPVLPVVDAFEVAPEVDGVVLVYEVGRIGRGILNRAKVQLENVDGNVLGVILNNVKPEVAPDFYRYRTDYYYEESGQKEKSLPFPRWRELIAQTVSRISGLKDLIGQAVLRISGLKDLTKLAGRKRSSAYILIVLIGLMLVAGLLWRNYSGVQSSSQQSLYLKRKIPTTTSTGMQNTKSSVESGKQFQAMTRSGAKQEPEPEVQKKEILADKRSTEVPQHISPESILAKKSSAAKEPESSLQVAAQIYESLPRVAKIRSGPGIHAPVLQRIRQGTQLKVVGGEGDWLKLKLRKGGTGWIYHALAQRVEPTPSLPPSQVASEISTGAEPAEMSIQRLVEKWRLAWEKGDVPAYIACYHPRFDRGGMDSSDWEKYMQNRFEGYSGRDVDLDEVNIQVKGSTAVVTFKQSYQTEKHRKYGLKTLHLRRDQDHWTILKEETVQPLSSQE